MDMKQISLESEKIRTFMEPQVVGDNFYLDMGLWCSRLFQEPPSATCPTPCPFFAAKALPTPAFFTKYKIPVIISKPVCARHHTDHEWIDLESITTYTNIFFDFAKQVVNRNE
jgi:hypothetical protein